MLYDNRRQYTRPHARYATRTRIIRDPDDDFEISAKLKLFIALVIFSVFAIPILIVQVTVAAKINPASKPRRTCDNPRPNPLKIYNEQTRRMLELAGLSDTLGTGGNSISFSLDDGRVAEVFTGVEVNTAVCSPQLGHRFQPNITVPASHREVAARYPHVLRGGYWRPERCVPKSRIAIVIPYRDRDEHLRVFVNVMHEFLQKQQLEYRIFVVEQLGPAGFNRAALLNIGVYEAIRSAVVKGGDEFSLASLAELADLFVGSHPTFVWPTPPPNTSDTSTVNQTSQPTTPTPTTMPGDVISKISRLYARIRSSFDCFAMHDVDLLPENERMPYSCPIGGPRHLVTASQKFSYKAIYGDYFGGASIVSLEQMLRVNGLSNLFFGWGGEDDDFATRMKMFWQIAQCPAEVGRYTALYHDNLKEEEKNPERFRLWDFGLQRWSYDGLNSLFSANLSIVSRTEEALFTHVRVHLDQWYVPPADKL